MAAKKKQKLKSFEVTTRITGRAVSYVEAESEEEARRLLRLGEARDEKVLEWEYDSIENVKENS
jgi:hypothetical protein